VNPETWRKIDLVLANPESPSEVLEITLLRPVTWIDANGCETGAVIPLELEETGISGYAEIKSVSPCPEIEQGAGRVVLATITHINSDVRVLRLANDAGSIELTGAHRLFSLDRGDWIATRDLQPGEVIQTRAGRVSVETIERKPGQHRVYNIEVETEHCFFVSGSGVLSHNENPCAGPNGKPLPNSKGGEGNPFLPDDPYSPESVSRRQSELRDQMGLSKDPDSPIPDQPPGRNLKSSHQADSTEHHATGERNVGTAEEHSRVAKGSNGLPRR
jgi:hypothetical protein